MLKVFQFLFPKTIHKENSPINGQIEVIEQFGKRAIKVEGLEQSGPIVERIWEEGIKKVTNYRFPSVSEESSDFIKNASLLITNILVLGLGGGSVVKVVNRHFPGAKVLGIEIDPVMIKLGKIYFGLSECQNLEIKICDALNWLKEICLNDSNHLNKYNLILVDLYVGKKVPVKSEKKDFLNGIKKLLSSDGVVIFNRLRGKKENLKFQQFLDKLKKVYHDIKILRPVINYLIICR